VRGSPRADAGAEALAYNGAKSRRTAAIEIAAVRPLGRRRRGPAMHDGSNVSRPPSLTPLMPLNQRSAVALQKAAPTACTIRRSDGIVSTTAWGPGEATSIRARGRRVFIAPLCGSNTRSVQQRDRTTAHRISGIRDDSMISVASIVRTSDPVFAGWEEKRRTSCRHNTSFAQIR